MVISYSFLGTRGARATLSHCNTTKPHLHRQQRPSALNADGGQQRRQPYLARPTGQGRGLSSQSRGLVASLRPRTPDSLTPAAPPRAAASGPAHSARTWEPGRTRPAPQHDDGAPARPGPPRGYEQPRQDRRQLAAALRLRPAAQLLQRSRALLRHDARAASTAPAAAPEAPASRQPLRGGAKAGTTERRGRAPEEAGPSRPRRTPLTGARSRPGEAGSAALSAPRPPVPPAASVPAAGSCFREVRPGVPGSYPWPRGALWVHGWAQVGWTSREVAPDPRCGRADASPVTCASLRVTRVTRVLTWVTHVFPCVFTCMSLCHSRAQAPGLEKCAW